MKSPMIALFAIIAALATTNAAQACISRVSEHRYFVVNMPGTQVIRAETGDLIRLTLSHPVIPGRDQVRFDESVLRPVTRVNVTPRDIVGVSTSEYFFEVIGGGDTTIEIAFVRSNGERLKGVTQEVQAKARPITRAKCM